jgi:putative colanic acid biosynthesis acetyltransferase WcaF
MIPDPGNPQQMLRAVLVEEKCPRPARSESDYPLIYTAEGTKRRMIRAHDLSRYKRPILPGNRNMVWRAAWYFVSACFFQGPILGLIPSSWKAVILRFFGASVGQGFVCKPRVTIKYPWFLRIGEHVWVGELVWIDNHTTVSIDGNVCISQGCYISTGNHDWDDERFRFFCKPIEIGHGCWVGAMTTITAGTHLAPGTVLGAGQ